MTFEPNVVAEHDKHDRPRVFAVIPARGGSTRLPDKNMRLFCGRPLIYWTIQAALCSHTVDEVWVSSDSDRILEFAKAQGAHVYKRPDVENDDAPGHVPMRQVCREVMRPTDILVGLMTTSPLRVPEEIDGVVKRYFALKDRADKMVCTLMPIHEDYRMRRVNDDYAEPLPPSENHNYKYDGAVHASTFAEYEHNVTSLGDNCYYVPYEIEEWQGFDVNSADQLRLSELIFYDRILRDSLNPYEIYRRGGLKA